MAIRDDEEERIRSVALQNAQSIHVARRRADEALRKQSEWLRVLASIGDAVISTDAEGRVTFMNGVAESMTGWLDGSATGRPLPDVFHIVHEHSREPVENPAIKAMREGIVVALANDTILISKDETEWPIDDTAAPIRNDQDKVGGVVLVFRDISQRKRQDAIQAERNRLVALRADVSTALASGQATPTALQQCCQALVSHLSVTFVGIWTLSDTEPVLESQARAGSDTHLDGPAARMQVGQFNIGRVVSTRKPFLTNDVANNQDLSAPEWAKLEGIVAFAGYPLIVEDRVLGVVALFSRQTVSEAVMTDLAPLANGIAQYIERKKSELERERLLVSEQAARKEAEQANRLKDEFLATASHELRTPLTAVVGWARLLRGGKLNAEHSARALESIERNANLQTKLIEDLLDTSRIITGKLTIDRHPIEMANVVNDAVNTVRPAADAKNITITTSYDPKTEPVLGDASRLQQVIWNLLSNAVKFTPKDGQIAVGIKSMDSQVEISVGDSGEGIDPEFLPYVFERFRQADGRTTRKHGGLGLGLAIVRHLVELHGGTVEARSDGKQLGATFSVRLPVVNAHDIDDNSDSVQAFAAPDGLVKDPMSVNCPPKLDGVRVLIVDDDLDTRQLLDAVLSQCDADVVTVGTAAEAVLEIERHKPDVLISDLGMPDQDGYELIKQVRKMEAKHDDKQTPALALTAYAKAEDRVRALADGYQIHLAKPVEPAELVLVVANLAGRDNGR